LRKKLDALADILFESYIAHADHTKIEGRRVCFGESNDIYGSISDRQFLQVHQKHVGIDEAQIQLVARDRRTSEKQNSQFQPQLEKEDPTGREYR
jgi:hypothetical protein